MGFAHEKRRASKGQKPFAECLKEAWGTAKEIAEGDAMRAECRSARRHSCKHRAISRQIISVRPLPEAMQNPMSVLIVSPTGLSPKLHRKIHPGGSLAGNDSRLAS